MKKESENDIVNACLQYLRLKNIFVWRQNNLATPTKEGRYYFRGMAGVSDIQGLLPTGRALYIECKTKRGIMSPAQEEFRKNVEKNKGLYILARSVDDLTTNL